MSQPISVQDTLRKMLNVTMLQCYNVAFLQKSAIVFMAKYGTFWRKLWHFLAESASNAESGKGTSARKNK